MYYLTDSDTRNYNVNYTVRSIKNYSYVREREDVDGIYGQLYYSTGYVPKEWSLEFSDYNPEALANYLLSNTVENDPRASKALSDYFWDYD